MKKFLFTLAALMMAGSAMADSGFFFGNFDEATLGDTNESTLVLTQDDLADEYEMPLQAYWSARVSGTECRITFPEGMTAVFAEPGADATVQTLNARGRAASETAAFAGLAEPYNHFVTTFSTMGYYKNDAGEIEAYGVNKWEAGFLEEAAIFYFEFDEGFQGGDIVVYTVVASGNDSRGGTVKENGEHAKGFTFTCHVTVEGAEPPAPEITDKPVITTEEVENGVVVTATGNGHICLYVEDMLVAEGEGTASYTIASTELEEEYGVSATAQEEGKEVSEYALETVYVPAYVAPVVYTDKPVINIEFNYDEEYAMISATGNGTVKLYIDGMEVSNPFMYRFQDEENEIVVTATAQEEGKEISETAEEVYVIPAKTPEPPQPEVTDKPTISYFVDMDNEVVIVTATGNGHICLYWDDQLMAEGEGTATWEIPFCEDPEGEEYGVSATAQEEGKEVSEYALETIEVPGKTVEPYETPAPVVTTDLTDDALVITATGEGTVTLYVQYINNETGEMTTETYTGEGTATATVVRGEEDAYINFWAVAQADADAVPGISETEYYFEVPAAEGVEPQDPHATGWWIVLTDINGEEIWYELHEGTDGSYVTTVTLNYGEYGTFYWDPELSAEENNVNRPNVPYYFVVNGQVWGAPEDGKATLMGEAANTMSNPLYENENHYTVPVGYSYSLGIYVDPSEDDQLQDGTKYYVYCAQGPQTDVDEVNAAKTVAGVRYFNLAGQEMQEANGMTIVVTTYTDGTTSAVKVMK